MLLNSSGSLKVGDSAGSVACNWALLSEVDRPAGAGEPLLVTAVAVVRFFMIVLLKTRTAGASLMLMPPPSWADTLFTTTLLKTFIGKSPAIRNRTPPPSSFDTLACTTLS